MGRLLSRVSQETCQKIVGDKNSSGVRGVIIDFKIIEVWK